MLKIGSGLLAAASLLVISSVTTSASATTFTTTSPTGGPLPSGVTEVGGVVLDLLGLNGARIVTQAAASSLYVGTPSSFPFTFGTQTGFTSSVISALGGGLLSASVRVTLYDGDSAPGDFDDGDNTLLLNGVNFGNFTSVATQETDSTGTTSLSTGFGFGDGILSTGFFTSTNAVNLAAFYSSLSGGSVAFMLDDVDNDGNFFDFTQGVDGSLINVGTGPIVTPPSTVPLPASLPMFGAGLLALVAVAFGRKRRSSTAA